LGPSKINRSGGRGKGSNPIRLDLRKDGHPDDMFTGDLGAADESLMASKNIVRRRTGRAGKARGKTAVCVDRTQY